MQLKLVIVEDGAGDKPGQSNHKLYLKKVVSKDEIDNRIIFSSSLSTMTIVLSILRSSPSIEIFVSIFAE